jgi:diguanylate cyclase
MATPLRVLLIEDSENDATLVVHELSQAGYDVASARVDTADALVAALEKDHWDLAIADYTMPQFSGTAALALLREYNTEIPFIFVSGTIGEDAAVAAMRSGAHDYIVKGQLKRLAPAVERELREVEVRRSRKHTEERLVHLAYHDPLTDLPNRLLLHDRLEQAVLAAQRTHEPLALIVLDLDGFKAINDSLGHYAGDRVLQQVASALRAALRETDTVARLGGDEFALMLPRTDGAGAERAAEKALQALKQPLVVDGQALVVRGSFGIAWYPAHGPTGDALLQQADIAMYVAKSANLGSAVYSADRDRHAHRRLAFITELRNGIEQDQFTCEYQPIVHLQTGAVIAMEALARWQHPDYGVLPPSEFIDLAEQTGLIEPLTMVLLDKALADWTAPDSRISMPVAVNLSPRTLRDAGLPERIATALQQRGLEPSALMLEITESCIIADPAGAVRCLTRLHDMGVKLAIDDFGTGYSSLSYLRLPVDVVKIDRSFVMGLATGDEAIVQSTIDLAHMLGLTVVAEGVESAVLQDRLRALGCDGVQGWFIERPASAAKIRRWAMQRRGANNSES